MKFRPLLALALVAATAAFVHAAPPPRPTPPPPPPAPTGTVAIYGVITLPNGLPAPFARVVVASSVQRIVSDGPADAHGGFSFSNLPPARYVLVAIYNHSYYSFNYFTGVNGGRYNASMRLISVARRLD